MRAQQNQGTSLGYGLPEEITSAFMLKLSRDNNDIRHSTPAELLKHFSENALNTLTGTHA
ncbi:MAG: hypothetical protein HC772_01365 [Leptolyngbyaceae cyanobacterium CRU_2_3]|nr:hypothetical protein [Leptolyngbyaceae cyanobacterium CRU_2_3]